MRPMTTEMLKKGYLLFPKALFEEQMNMKTGEKAADAFEAFVFVLTHVNYSTVTCNVRGHLFDCVRGESVLSLARWMEILGWPRNRTRYFFNKMFDAGIVERVANPYVMHIHDITEHPKVNIGRARREWKKLTAGEKQRALDNIDEYYDHLNNQKYCKQAATYLADKSFENEYDD